MASPPTLLKRLLDRGSTDRPSPEPTGAGALIEPLQSIDEHLQDVAILEKWFATTGMRSDELAREAASVFPQSCDTDFSDDLQASLVAFSEARHTLVSAISPGQEVARPRLHEPMRVLVVDWASSLFDGALPPETAEFFDHDGMPAWDSWLALARAPSVTDHGLLVCLVPSEIATKVDVGISIDAAGSISWLRHTEQGYRLGGFGVQWADTASW